MATRFPVKGHGGKRLGVLMAGLATLGLCGALAISGLRRSPVVNEPLAASLQDPQTMLAEANRYYQLWNFPAATPLYQRAEELFEQTHDRRDALYSKIGRIRCSGEMSYPEISAFAAQQLRTPLVEHDAPLRLWCLVIKGDTDLEINVDAARRDWQAAQTLGRQLNENLWVNRATGELGLLSFLQGNPAKASAMVGKAFFTAMATGDVGGEVRYLELIGHGFNQLNRQAEATMLFDHAIQLAESHRDSGFPFMAYEGKAESLFDANRKADAQNILQQTLVRARNDHRWDHEAQDLLILAEFALKSNDTQQARTYLQMTLEAGQRVGFPRFIMKASLDLAEMSRKAGNLKEAEAELRQGLAASRQAGDTYYLPDTLTALASLQTEMGSRREAYASYERAEDIIDGMLLHASSAYSESALLSEMSDSYLGEFRLAAQEGGTGKAFRVIERARGRAIVDDLKCHPTAPQPSTTDRLTEDQIAQLQTRLMGSNDPSERSKLLDQLAEAEERLQYVQSTLNPKQRRVTTEPVELGNAQRSLLPDEAVLEYVLAEPTSFCLAFSQKATAIVKLPAGQKQIEQLTSNYLAQIQAGNYDEEDAKKLYSLLLASVPDFLRAQRLVVVPDGSLWELPFETLRGPDGQYVLASHTVSYAPSTTVRCYLKALRDTREPQMAFLGVGAVPYDLEPKDTGVHRRIMGAVSRGIYDISGEHLYELPSSRQEIIDADQALGKPKGAVLLLGADATESKFKSQPLTNFKIIHFAVHGLSTPKFPERAALVLGRDSHSNDDGLLQVREIARLSLAADLVTLSACDTGRGKLEGEEGTTGLVEAFLLAGAKNVVASLWAVDDSATEILMKHFYAHLAEEQDVTSALRQAKLDYLAEVGNRPPVFWGAFTAVGDASTPINFRR